MMRTILFDSEGRPLEAVSYGVPPPELRPGEAEVTAEQHAAWPAMRLVDDAVVVDHDLVLSMAQAAARRVRNTALAASDWTDLPNARLTAEQLAAWQGYRSALFDWPTQPGWPNLPLPSSPNDAA